MRRRQHPRPPDDLLSGRLAAGERQLAAARVDGGWAVATTAGLWLALPEPTRLWWDEIDRVNWQGDTLTITRLIGAAGARSLRLLDRGRLPEVVRDRVTASIALSERHRLADGSWVRVIARRRWKEPGLRWSLLFDAAPETVPAAARDEAERRLAEARARAGG